MNDRPIKMHLDEEMRAHIEFVIQRYRTEVREFLSLATRNHKLATNLEEELYRTDQCLKEAQVAGT
jgi:hypothetical protein